MLDASPPSRGLSGPTPRPGLWRRLTAPRAPDPKEGVTSPVAPDPRVTRRRAVYDAIGRFLFDHELDLTPLNFGCAHDYVAQDDPPLVRAVNAARDEGRLTNSWIENYLVGRPGNAMTPDTLISMAADVEAELERCLGLLKRSRAQAADYGDALAAEVERPATGAMIEQLVGITRAMIEHTRDAEREMRRSHKQASDLRATLRAARKASETDHLTGLPNRRGFERLLRDACAQSSRPSLSIVIAVCDIDRFKTVNDRFGHDTGDRVLEFVARELMALRRHGAQVARLGGEEFVIVFADCGLRRAAMLLDGLRGGLASRNLVDRSTQAAIGRITFSAGLSPVADPANPMATLKLADSALYAAKHAGRNRVYLSAPDGGCVPLAAEPEAA